jgi:hypothetical protein
VLHRSGLRNATVCAVVWEGQSREAPPIPSRSLVTMMLIATLVGSLVTNAGRSAWCVGALLVMVYGIFAWTLYLLPPRVQWREQRTRAR